MRLLLVEDDNTTVESVKLCLEIYEPTTDVKSAGRGLEALRLLKTEQFDAVLIDLGLPDIDGIEVIERMRTFSRIPVVVLSARHSPEVIAQALTLGADDYITKPFDYRLLLKRLHKLIEKSQSDHSPTKD
ncbi:MAG TPA: response regulator [Dehalococcoidales bacterium]|nr:response regulator [Dehalococcoidales bacterium]